MHNEISGGLCSHSNLCPSSYYFVYRMFVYIACTVRSLSCKETTGDFPRARELFCLRLVTIVCSLCQGDIDLSPCHSFSIFNLVLAGAADSSRSLVKFPLLLDILRAILIDIWKSEISHKIEKIFILERLFGVVDHILKTELLIHWTKTELLFHWTRHRIKNIDHIAIVTGIDQRISMLR